MLRRLVAAAVALGTLAAAQVQTKCNPRERDGCPSNPGFGTDATFHFNHTPSNDLWETTVGSVKYDSTNGGAFTINKQGDSPTIRTRFYFFFGRTEVWIKVAPGRGIVSSMMWLSDDLDEVDWEFLGSNTTHATTNFFGKGRQDYHNGGSHPMTGMQSDFHNYTTVWTREKIEWYIDGDHVRTLLAAEANNTQNYPQTPMRMSIGIWAGGDPSLPEGTRKWAGGDTDYAGGPYTMYLQKARITDFSTGQQYVYGDRSGSWESIKSEGTGNSTAADALAKQPVEEKTMSQKWAELPAGARIAVMAGGGSIGAVILGALLFYFCRQRRIGAKEAKAADQRAEAERVEMEQFHQKGGYASMIAARSIQDDDHHSTPPSRGDADSYHGPETTASGPLGDNSWGNAGGASAVSQHPPRLSSPAVSASSQQQRGSASPVNTLGFDFGVPLSPISQHTSSPISRCASPLSRSQSPGMPPPGPLPSPRGGPMRNGSAPVAPGRMASAASQAGRPAGPDRSVSGNQ